MWGARGNVKLTMEVGKPGILSFEFTGADFSFTDGSLLVSTYPTVIPPAFLNASLMIDSYAAICKKVDLDTANVLALRESLTASSGYLSCLVMGRNPKGSMDPEMTLVATYDFYGKWRTPGTLGALSLSANGTAGNIATVSCPKVRYASIRSEDRGGIRNLGIDFEPTMNTGDDEISIAMT